MKPLRTLSILIFFFACPFLFAAETEIKPKNEDNAIKQETEWRRFSVSPGLDYSSLSFDTGSSFTGIGIFTTFRYGIFPKVGIGGVISQSLDMSSSFAPLFTQGGFELTYAITGSLIQKKEEVVFGKHVVSKSKTQAEGGLRIQALGSQYLFHSSTTVVPLAGYGGALIYEHPLFGQLFRGGVKYEQVSSDTRKVNLLRIFVGLGFWF